MRDARVYTRARKETVPTQAAQGRPSWQERPLNENEVGGNCERQPMARLWRSFGRICFLDFLGLFFETHRLVKTGKPRVLLPPIKGV